MDKLTVLRSARKLLSDPKRWGKGRYASRNSDGETCYCALGALRAAVGFDDFDDNANIWEHHENSVYMSAQNELIKTIRTVPWANINVPNWNDAEARTYEDVMSAFSATCERVFAEQQATDQEVALA